MTFFPPSDLFSSLLFFHKSLPWHKESVFFHEAGKSCAAPPVTTTGGSPTSPHPLLGCVCVWVCWNYSNRCFLSNFDFAPTRGCTVSASTLIGVWGCTVSLCVLLLLFFFVLQIESSGVNASVIFFPSPFFFVTKAKLLFLWIFFVNVSIFSDRLTFQIVYETVF